MEHVNLDGKAAPLHAQIYESLLNDIASGHLSPGDQLPTESDLREQFDVSRTTVRRALHDLATKGLVSREPGRGTFVASPRLDQDLRRLTGFAEDAAIAGFEAQAKVLEVERIAANHVVAERLDLQTGRRVYRFKRIRMANWQPVSLDVTYFIELYGERLAKEDLEVKPFYSILEDEYGVELGFADYVIQAEVATQEMAASLKTELGSPILFVERTTHLREGSAPIMYEHLHYRADRMRYRMRIDR